MSKQLDITVQLVAKLQSSLHSINELELDSGFIRAIEKQTNSYSKFLEKRLAPIYKEMPLKQTSDFIDVVGKIDKLANELKVEIKIEE